MIFNSLIFLYFFIVVYTGFLLLGRFSKNQGQSANRQNVWLLFWSYFFYGWWNWLLLSLVFSSTIIDYFAAIGIQKSASQKRKRIFLSISLLGNLGLLFTMKYLGFFAESFVFSWNHTAALIGFEAIQEVPWILTALILPVGISFYTFQTLSYTIDVYRGQIQPERNFITFALFVTYFPQLIAGPIERASDLLPQLKKHRLPSREMVRDGLWNILLGYYLKVYVADNLAPLVDKVYQPFARLGLDPWEMADKLSAGQIFSATLGFLFQIYADFAGYSFIALGLSCLMGVRLTTNFLSPEYSENPAQLWQNWHTTLNRWFRDYVYIPLGGSRISKGRQILNIIIVFVLSGLWHGANFTFVVWGFLNGLYTGGYLFLRWRNEAAKQKNPELQTQGKIKINYGGILLTFSLFLISALAFRSDTTAQMIAFYKGLFWNWGAAGTFSASAYIMQILKILFPLLVLDYFIFRNRSQYFIFSQRKSVQTIVYLFLFYSIILEGIFGKEVIYFAF